MEREIEARLGRVEEWIGWSLGLEARRRLVRWASWLEGEAIPAGGLGPQERDRVWDRHVLDSLLFARAWSRPHPPEAILDLGSGVGLPGVPLALLWPQTSVTLLDRRQRRGDLARRGLRVLGLENVEVMVVPVEAYTGRRADLVVSRALGEAGMVLDQGLRLALSGGVIAVGGSWRRRPETAGGETILEVPRGVLDRPVWLRIMAAP